MNSRKTLFGFGDVEIQKVSLTKRLFVAKNQDTGRGGYRAYPLGEGSRGKYTAEVIVPIRQSLMRFTLYNNYGSYEEFSLLLDLTKPNSMKKLADKLVYLHTPPWQYFAAFIYGVYWECQAGMLK